MSNSLDTIMQWIWKVKCIPSWRDIAQHRTKYLNLFHRQKPLNWTLKEAHLLFLVNRITLAAYNQREIVNNLTNPWFGEERQTDSWPRWQQRKRADPALIARLIPQGTHDFEASQPTHSELSPYWILLIYYLRIFFQIWPLISTKHRII